MDISNILNNELKGSVDFFLNFTNLNKDSKGFGLTVDSTRKPQVASIASVGFALTAWIIAEKRGFISYQKALDITKKTLHTLCYNASHHHGFFAHFLYMENGERFRKSEFSTIDTSLCLNGVITAAAYFQDEEINQMAELLLGRVDWNYIIFERAGKTLFRMAYNPDKNGDYVEGKPGFISQWDMAAEQKMMYLQAAVRVEPSVARRLYGGFTRNIGDFEGHRIIINPVGSLFAYQFSEAWFDSERYLDPDGIDWFNNTCLAASANRKFCIENSEKFQTYHTNSWGMSDGDSPWGYAVYGSTPCLGKPEYDGTVSIYAALASLPFIPELTTDMIQFLYQNHPQTWGPYGFYDSYNLDVTPAWYSHSIYGINKGCSMIMIENHLSRLIWDTYTNSPTIQKGLDILGFTKREGKSHG